MKSDRNPKAESAAKYIGMEIRRMLLSLALFSANFDKQ